MKNYQRITQQFHLLLSRIVNNKGLSGSGLSIPSLRARASLLTYSLMLASEANTQLV